VTAARLRGAGLAAAGTAAIVVLAWPIPGHVALVGLDPSWRAATHLAHADGLAWGRDVVLPEGPLGFLAEPLLVVPGITYPLSVLAPAALLAAWVLVLVRSLAPRLGRLGAWLLAAATAALLVAPLLRADRWGEVALALLVVLGLRAVERARISVAGAAGLGAAGALLFLVRTDSGAAWLVLGAATVAAATPPGSRCDLLRGAAVRVAAFAGAAVVAGLLGWLLAGQPLDALPDWLRGVRELFAGYSGSAAIEDAPAWHYAAAALLSIAVLVLAAATTGLGGRRWVLVALAAVALVVGARQSFVRHDTDHAAQFFLLAAAVALALAAGTGRLRLSLAAAGAGTLLAVAAGSLDANPLRVDQRASAAADQLHLVVSPGARGDELRANRAEILRGYGLPAGFATLARGRTVHVMPWDASLAAALPGARWRPLPVVQDYMASTSALDRRNARALAGPRRPEVILRRAPIAIDGRLERFEPPAAALALACRYRLVADERTTGWQALRAGPDRCGHQRPLGRVRAPLGTVVPVPPAAPNEAVLVRFAGIARSLRDRVRIAVLRGPRVKLSLAGGLPLVRIPIDTQSSPHLLTAPRCFTAALDGIPLPVVRGVSVVRWKFAGGGPVEARFSAMPVGCAR
jgi:hypothetical protein